MESERHEQSATSGVPRGGPIFLPNTVGHLSSMTEFQSSFFNLLQDLDTHLSLESPSSSQQYDISTDTLKVYTDVELTDMAMKEAFPEDNLSQNELEQSLIVSHIETPSAGRLRNPPKKRKLAKNEESLCNMDTYVGKVEHLAKLKQKQEEDKATVSLHCFRKSCENGKDVAAFPEGFGQMQCLKYIDNYTLVKPSDIQGQVDALFPEVILCVEIYNSRKLKTQEFLVLGRQVLTELKEKIHCRTDQIMEKAGTYDPSGYFLIEDVFHNDLRNPSATDYSKPILDWLWYMKDEALAKWECILTGELRRKQKAVLGQAKSMDLPRFGSADMQSTRFCDLKFRLGANYIYCHHGDCKHTMVIRDMRLSHPEDVQNREAYPKLVYQVKRKFEKCSICNMYRATKFAVDVKWAKENPCYFCDICFAQLHLEGGSLNYGFPIYDYVHESNII